MNEIVGLTRSLVSIIRDKTSTLAQPEAKRLCAPCPKCSSPIEVRGKAFVCTSCDFKLWNEITGRKLSDIEADTLLVDGKTAVLSGFTGKTGRKFSAKVRLNMETVKTEFEFE